MGRRKERWTWITDFSGTLKLKIAEGVSVSTQASLLGQTFQAELERSVTFGDGGVIYPYFYVLLGDHLIDLTHLHLPEHMMEILELEAKEVPDEEPCVLIFTQKLLEKIHE